MELKHITFAIVFSLVLLSCVNTNTEYNGYIKNSTESTTTLKLIGKNLLLDSISISSGETKKIHFHKEDGDFEIYDCRSFFDTIKYTAGENSFLILSDSANIISTSSLESNEIRVHNCLVEIK